MVENIGRVPNVSSFQRPMLKFVIGIKGDSYENEFCGSVHIRALTLVSEVTISRGFNHTYDDKMCL